MFPPEAVDGRRAVLSHPMEELEATIQVIDKLTQDAVHEFSYTLSYSGVSALREVGASLDYDMTVTTYERLSATDPLLAAFKHEVVDGCTLALTFSLLHKPEGVARCVECIAEVVALELTEVWSSKSVNEFGALLVEQQLREIMSMIESWHTEVPVRRIFGRLQQIVQVLSVESVPDVYNLMFPVPLLKAEEVRELLRHRVGFSAKALEAVQWQKVPLADTVT